MHHLEHPDGSNYLVVFFRALLLLLKDSLALQEAPPLYHFHTAQQSCLRFDIQVSPYRIVWILSDSLVGLLGTTPASTKFFQQMTHSLLPNSHIQTCVNGMAFPLMLVFKGLLGQSLAQYKKCMTQSTDTVNSFDWSCFVQLYFVIKVHGLPKISQCTWLINYKCLILNDSNIY